MKSSIAKLDFGCGYEKHEGWLGLDKEDNGQKFHVDVLRPEGLPIADNTFDMIVANHVLHMFSWDELNQKVLPELLRILKKGAVLRIIDMSPVKAFRRFESQNKAGMIIPDDVEESMDGKFCQYLTWYGTRKSICTPLYMQELLQRAGFFLTGVLDSDQTIASGPRRREILELDSRWDESYIVEGMK